MPVNVNILPSGSVTTSVNPLLLLSLIHISIRLIDEGWSTWAEIGNSAELTYVSLDGTVQTKTQEPPFAYMKGFEGFVFTPYEALSAGSTPGRAITEHMQAAGWNIEIGYYKRNEDEIGPNYLYDNIGLYTDIEGYIAAAGRVVEHPDEEPDDQMCIRDRYGRRIRRA